MDEIYFDIEFIERKRLALQAVIDKQKPQLERNRLGQFATPTNLARQIVNYGLILSCTLNKIRFLDPAIGTGAFFSALIFYVPKDNVIIAEGFEIDESYSKPAQELWSDTILKINNQDFTSDTPPQNKFNFIVCNPPYVRHHHIPVSKKLSLKRKIQEILGYEINGLSGLYCYFLLLSHEWMEKNAIACWLIPSEFMDVNYGKLIKNYLLNEVELIRIHRFEPNVVQFGDALVSSAVVWLKNCKIENNYDIEFSYGGDINKPRISKKISKKVLQNESKWTRFPLSKGKEYVNGLKLKDYFFIKRGLATGANNFFVLSKEKILELNLPFECFKPILPSPRYLKKDEIFADNVGNPILDQELFLLDCPYSEAEIKLKYQKLWKYLAKGIPSIKNRYLCRSRNPWYSQEKRPPVSILCTYIGRADTKNGIAFRFILNHSQATATNTYLMFYPKNRLKHIFEKDEGLIREIWSELKAIKQQDLLYEGRVYGGGMHKLEPKELANVSAEFISKLLIKRGYNIHNQTKFDDCFTNKDV